MNTWVKGERLPLSAILRLSGRDEVSLKTKLA